MDYTPVSSFENQSWCVPDNFRLSFSILKLDERNQQTQLALLREKCACLCFALSRSPMSLEVNRQ